MIFSRAPIKLAGTAPAVAGAQCHWDYRGLIKTQDCYRGRIREARTVELCHLWCLRLGDVGVPCLAPIHPCLAPHNRGRHNQCITAPSPAQSLSAGQEVRKQPHWLLTTVTTVYAVQCAVPMPQQKGAHNKRRQDLQRRAADLRRQLAAEQGVKESAQSRQQVSEVLRSMSGR